MDSKLVVKEEISVKKEREGSPASRSVDSSLGMSSNSSRQPSPTRSSPVSGESETSSAAIDQLLEIKDAQDQLILKQEKIKAAKEFLAGLKDWLHSNVDTVPVVGDWLEDIGAILKQNELPRLVLGLMGDSGCGKSSVLNALIGEECLLPCNSSEACTAVAVEVAWNAESDKFKAYKAIIQFFSQSEWREELESLVPQILALPANERINPTSDDAKVAAAKFKAVYPNYPLDKLEEKTIAQLVKISSVSGLLGRHEEIIKFAGKGAQFAAEISQYIDSSVAKNAGSYRETSCWPLIKVVQIFTKSPVLATGLVLVDLPGLGDSNAARAIVAEDYMNQVSAICVVADIKRALTNAFAKNLMEEELRSSAACAKEVIKALGLKETNPLVSGLLLRQESISNDLRTKRQRIHELKERNKIRFLQIVSLERDTQTVPVDEAALCSPHGKRKRKRTDDAGNSSLESPNDCLSGLMHTRLTSQRRSVQTHEEAKKKLHSKKKAQMKAEDEIKVLLKETDDLNIELDGIENDLKLLCIQKRNQYVKHRMEVDYPDGLREFERELYEEEDQTLTPTVETSERTPSKCVATFCVCSKAYQKLEGRFDSESLPQGFLHVEDTQMPQLIRHCTDYTLPARGRLANALLEDVDRLRSRMKGWADNTTPDKQITMVQKRILEECFRDHLEMFQKTILQSIELVIKNLQQNLNELNEAIVKVAAPKAAATALDIYKQWTETIKGSSWMAICRKDGIHQFKKGSPDGINYNWNEELAEPLTEHLDKYLNKFFSTYLPALLKEHTIKLEEAGKLFPHALEESSTAITEHVANPLQNFLYNLQRLEVEMQRGVEARFAETVVICKTADRIIPDAIALALKPAFKEAKRIFGAGGFQRSKVVINRQIRLVRCTMYKDAAEKAVRILMQSIIVLQTNLKKDFDLCIKRIEKDFSKMLELASATPRPESGPAKIKLQGETLQQLDEFDVALSQDAIKNGRYPEYGEASCLDDDGDESPDRDCTPNSGEGEHLRGKGTCEAADKLRFQTFSDEEDSDGDDGQA